SDLAQLKDYIKSRLVTFVLFDNDLTLTQCHTWHAINQVPAKPGHTTDCAKIIGKTACPQQNPDFNFMQHFDPTYVNYAAYNYAANLRFPEQTAQTMRALSQQTGVKVGVSTRHPYKEPVKETVKHLLGAEQDSILACPPYFQKTKLDSMYDFASQASAVQ